jgi:hypothetical protein
MNAIIKIQKSIITGHILASITHVNNYSDSPMQCPYTHYSPDLQIDDYGLQLSPDQWLIFFLLFVQSQIALNII